MITINQNKTLTFRNAQKGRSGMLELSEERGVGLVNQLCALELVAAHMLARNGKTAFPLGAGGEIYEALHARLEVEAVERAAGHLPGDRGECETGARYGRGGGMKKRTDPTVIRVGSAPMCYSPGVWNWFTSGALRDRSDEWKCEFLSAFTRGRLTRVQQTMILAGDYLTTIEGETVVITVPKP